MMNHPRPTRFLKWSIIVIVIIAVLIGMRTSSLSLYESSVSDISRKIVPETDHNSMEYKHVPIDPKTEFRLVELQPGNLADELFGKIYTLKISSTQIYEALSYAWEVEELTHEFHCDDGTGAVRITSSLYRALKRVRNPKHIRHVWADGICIDQKNESEKAHQVALMPKIYKNAFGVKVYLGEAIEESKLAFDLAQKLRDAKFPLEPPFRIFDEQLPDYGLPTEDDPAWAAFRSLLRRPWFQRVWIVQEIVLAKRCLVMAGNEVKHWDVFPSALQIARKHMIMHVEGSVIEHARPAKISTQRGAEALTRLHWFRQSSRQGNKWPLMELLTLFRNSQAKIPRDHLFSLLGLASDGDRQALYPNYTEPDEDVYRRYGKFFIESTSQLDLLYSAGISVGNLTMPSWIPDWTTPTPKKASFGSNIYSHIYFASLGANASPSFTEDPETLLVSGGVVDIVKGLGQGDGHWEHSGVKAPGLQVAKRWIDEMDVMAASLQEYPTGEEISQVKWKTLIAGRTQQGWDDNATEAPAEYAHAYDAAKQYVTQIFESRGQDALSTRIQDANLAGTNHQDLLSAAQPYFAVAQTVQAGVKTCVTEGGYLGLVPSLTLPGDRIAIICGCRVPFVVRPIGDSDNKFRLIGECYIHGIMKGEAYVSSSFEEKKLQLV